MSIALGTNVLAYAEGANGTVMRNGKLCCSGSASGEILRTYLFEKSSGAPVVRGQPRWRDAYAVVDTSATVIADATNLAPDDHALIWDSVLLAASTEADCQHLCQKISRTGLRGAELPSPIRLRPPFHPTLADQLMPSEESKTADVPHCLVWHALPQESGRITATGRKRSDDHRHPGKDCQGESADLSAFIGSNLRLGG